MESAQIIEPRPRLEDIAHELSDHVLDLLDAGNSPHVVCEAALLAAIPILLEVTKLPTIEAMFGYLAASFDGNVRRQCGDMN
ncbi:MAG: hypothetical protein HY245_03945 [Rhizobiales bacterium]|nr:hypothetical protein [Hyphomicrobiales bacterium]MBI3672574.1 hypothetical protein [Hyphomicrobiales bacterium]